MSSSSAVTYKNDQPIREGDEAWTKIRGGKREGAVEKIVRTGEDAQKEKVKNPPKVLLEDQHGHHVAHNPETL
ncbi:hypothetical protein MMC11_009117 [Xylographa trunciseda]|nr:hypothetical protein [Xylographa trunciseda]